ncbi:hypothetical protein DL96DRAFT_1710201 [Flagelloscypha sp. PMI_526]|nr:hypothetical protein DL96DRAFT_1710201 [Flagelloscypha sp. PMI_526]
MSTGDERAGSERSARTRKTGGQRGSNARHASATKANKKSHIEIDSDSEIQELQAPPPSTTSKSKQISRSKPSSSSQTNGHYATTSVAPSSNARGRAKADTSSRRQQTESGTEMDVDEEIVDKDSSMLDEDSVRPRTGKASSNSSRSDSDKKVKRLEQRLATLNTQYKKVVKQFKELSDLRQTQVEQNSREMEENYEAQLKAKQSIIDNLLKEVTDPLYKDDGFSVANLVTREEADQEKKDADIEIESLRQALAEKEQALKEQQTVVAEKEQSVKELQFELKLERDRSSKQAAVKNTPGSSQRRDDRQRLDPVEEPKHAAVLNVYEDLTGLLITHARRVGGTYLDKDEWIYSCVYTPRPDATALNFQLRAAWDLSPDASEPVTEVEQLVHTMHYSPLNLQLETPEFVDNLQFLNEAFTFTRDQLGLFLFTLRERLLDANGMTELGVSQ